MVRVKSLAGHLPLHLADVIEPRDAFIGDHPDSGTGLGRVAGGEPRAVPGARTVTGAQAEGRPVRAVVRAGSTGLTLLAGGPWLAWLPLDLLDKLPGTPLRALPLVGRFLGHNRHRTTAGYAYLADAHLVERWRRSEQSPPLR